MTFGHRCFHSCATLQGTCAQCVEFKRVAGVAAFDALFPKVGGAALGGEQQAKAASVPPVTSAPTLRCLIEAKRSEIQSELNNTPYTSDRFTMLYSAQQALGWAVAGVACPVELAKKWTNGDGSFIKPDEQVEKCLTDHERITTAAMVLYHLSPIVKETRCPYGNCDTEYTSFSWDAAEALDLLDDYYERAQAALEAIAA